MSTVLLALRRIGVAALWLMVAGCGRPAATGDSRPPTANQLVRNMLASNGANTLRDLRLGSLDASLQKNTALLAELADPDTSLFFQYMVECALPPGQGFTLQVGAESMAFDGSLGLATEWATGPCDTACQEWMTACLLARTNLYGIPVALSIRGKHPNLTVDESEKEAFPIEEGAFYGNEFLAEPEMWPCSGRGDDPISLTVRRCAQAGAACGGGIGYAHAGPCAATDATGKSVAKPACDGGDATVGFGPCRDSKGKVWTRALTTFLKRSQLDPGNATGCGEP